ncbi:MAG: hypothetical protein Q9218_004526 [Villophora microphyllina]
MAVFHRKRRLRSAPNNHPNDGNLHREHPKEFWQEPSNSDRKRHQGRPKPGTQISDSHLRAPACTPERGPTIHPSTPEFSSLSGSWTWRPPTDVSRDNQASSWDPCLHLKALHISSGGLVRAHDKARFAESTDILSLRSRGADTHSCSDPSSGLSDLRGFPSPAPRTKSKSTFDNTAIKTEHRDTCSGTLRPDSFDEGLQHSHGVASPTILPIQSNAVPLNISIDHTTIAGNHHLTDSSRQPDLLPHNDQKTSTGFYMQIPASDGPLSPHYLSQPESPSIRDFEEAWALESNGSQRGLPEDATEHSQVPGGADGLLQMPKLPGVRLSVYHLPEVNQASASTLQKVLPVGEIGSSEVDTHRLVESWNDGSIQRGRTQQDALVDDLGYLGQVII